MRNFKNNKPILRIKCKIMKVFKITGKVFYKNIGIGAWGIRDLSGKEYRPNFMPEQLKTDGARVSITAKKAEEGFSMHIWGEAIDILGFHTLNPF